MSLCVQEMSHFQMCMEKTSLQKSLLYFESLHGRPVRLTQMLVTGFNLRGTSNSKAVAISTFVFVCLQSARHERTLIKPFYDRYRLLKQLLLSSATTTVITTIVSKHLTLKSQLYMADSTCGLN